MARPAPPLRDTLRNRAAELGVPMEVLEKDYALSYLLAGIYGNEDLRSSLVFKGGTALRKAHFGDYRFSVDLDFTAVGGPRGNKLEAAISDATAAAQRLLRERGPFSVAATRRSEKAPHPASQEAFQVQVGFPWHSRPVCSLKIEISTDEVLALAPARRPMLHAYEEDLSVELRCYPIEEIAAEKLRTPAQVQVRLDQGKWPRNCARDYYDLWRLFTLPESEFDRRVVASILSKKCEARGVCISKVQDVFPRFIVAEAERQWSSSLADLVTPRLEELNHLYETLSAEERDELLQCLLIAAPRGGEAMVKVLEQATMCRSVGGCHENIARSGSEEVGGFPRTTR